MMQDICAEGLDLPCLLVGEMSGECEDRRGKAENKTEVLTFLQSGLAASQ